MESIYKLYQAVPLKPERNYWIDNIKEFLVPYYVESKTGQFFKGGLTAQLKLNNLRSEAFLVPFNYLEVTNYLDNGGVIKLYYFITKLEPLGSETILLTLELDVINTFLSREEELQGLNSDGIIFDPRTNIKREHQNRFYNIKSSDGKYLRKIDVYNEGIEINKYRRARVELEDHNGAGRRALLYRNKLDISPDNDLNPVECCIVPEEEVKISKGVPQVVDIFYSLIKKQRKEFYFYMNTPGYAIQIRLRNALTGPDDYINKTIINNSTIYCLAYSNDYEIGKAGFRIKRGDLQEDGTYKWTDEKKVIDAIKCTQCNYCRVLNDAKPVGVDDSPTFNRLSQIEQLPKEYFSGGIQPDETLIKVKEINTADPRIIKFISLPYAPFTIEKDSNNFLVYDKSKYTYEEGYLKLINLSTTFFNKLNIELRQLNVSQFLGYRFTPDVTGYANRNINLESKLFHSDFFTYKITYDVFNYQLELERFRPKESIEEGFTFPTLTFAFKPTNSINSKLAFKILIDEDDTGVRVPYYYLRNEDYSNLLMSDRNNEIVVYNNAYVNYIKSGYNYDKESKILRETNNWLNTAIQLGGSALGAAASIAGGNLVTGASAVSLGVSAVQSLANNVEYSITSNKELAHKLQSLKMQATGVSGANDLDLLKYYNKNKLRIFIYKPSDQVSDTLNDLFFYTGYAHPKKEVPNTVSRIYFNYLECEPYFRSEFLKECNINNEMEEALKTKFIEGVTRFHKYNNNYDLEQVKENYEVDLMEVK